MNNNIVYYNIRRVIGRKWFNLFQKRWSHRLSHRIPQNVSLDRAKSVDIDVLDNYFNRVEEMLTEAGVLDKPTHIWNVDESGFNCDQGSMKILTKRGLKSPSRLVINNEKVSYTVTFCANAAGHILPPYILFAAKNLYDAWCVGGPTGAYYYIIRF